MKQPRNTPFVSPAPGWLPIGLGLALLLGWAKEAGAESTHDALSRLRSEDPAVMLEAIDELGHTESPDALEVLLALRDGALRIDADGRLLAMEAKPSESYVDLTSGMTVNRPTPPLRAPLVTNAVRRRLLPATAQLQLRFGDQTARREAALALSKEVSPASEAVLRQALADEHDPEVRALLEVAMARLDFESLDAGRRLAALETVQRRKDVSFRAQVEALLTHVGEADGHAAVSASARRTLATIERQELLTRVVRDLFYGVSLGSVLLLAALGLAITFGLMGVINMAHGEMLMLGAYATYVTQTLFRQYLPGHLDLYLVAAVPVAFIGCFLVGMVLERGIIRFLYGRPLETLLATWGISLLLIQAVRSIFGAQNVSVANPQWLSGGWEVMAGVAIPYARITTVAFAASTVGLVWALLTRTQLGLQMRAITQNRGMAKCVGVATARVDTLTFGLGSAVAGLGGVALSQLGNVGPELGQLYIVDSFMVVVLGGVGKLAGTLVSALGLGVVNKVLEPISGAVLGKIIVLGFIILFIQKRPQGLFALKGRAAEGS